MIRATESPSGTAGAGAKLPQRTALILLLILAALLVACGDDDVSDPTSITSATTTPEPTTMPASPTSTPDTALTGYSAARAMEHARILSEDVGSRPAGSQAELAAAEYIRAQLTSFGYDADLQPFPIQTYLVLKADLTAEQGGELVEIESTPLTRSGSGRVEASLVDGGLGYPEDLPGETSGAVLLLDRGEITFSEKVANAVDAGAAGVVILNNEGGPFGGTLIEDVVLPVVSISRDDGLELRALLEEGDVAVTLDVEIQANDSTSNNVLAGADGAGCRVVAGGHYDSVPAGPGANDNASGTSVVLEIARALAVDGPPDGVCFAFFGAEEIGLLGSRHYVAATPLDDLEAMLNFDMLGVGDGWPLGGSGELQDLAAEIADDLAISYRLDAGTETGGSDHAPFIDLGVPALILNCFCDPNYHTAADRFGFLEEERMAEAGALGMELINRLLVR